MGEANMNSTNILPERDAKKPATHQGAFRKYDVLRVDGKQDPDGTDYFVLRAGDPLAVAAIDAYATAAQGEYPMLAADLRARFLERPSGG